MCADTNPSFRSSGSVPIDQIEQGEQINPHDVNKVPVQPHYFYRRVINGSEAAFEGLPNYPDQQSCPDDHVQSVQTGHGEVQREIELRMSIECRQCLAR